MYYDLVDKINYFNVEWKLKTQEDIENLQLALLAAFEGATARKDTKASGELTKLIDMTEWIMDKSRGSNTILNFLSNIKVSQIKNEFWTNEQMKERYAPVIARYREG